MRPARLIWITLAMGACGSHHPGPCTATRDELPSASCTMLYDDFGRQISTDCRIAFPSAGIDIMRALTRTFVGDALVGIHIDLAGDDPGTIDWSFGDLIVEDQVRTGPGGTARWTNTYDPVGFGFMGHPFDPENVPAAPDALVHRWVQDVDGTITETDFTYEGDAPRQGTRIRTGGGWVATFTYDVEGRLRERTLSGEGELDEVFDYDDERLIAIRAIEGATTNVGSSVYFEYDEHGNLLRKTRGSGVMEFGYDCW